jgi:RING/Ubox like zinc-binding domain
VRFISGLLAKDFYKLTLCLLTSPLCIEEFDLSDKNFKPCPCGYQVCLSLSALTPKPPLLRLYLVAYVFTPVGLLQTREIELGPAR